MANSRTRAFVRVATMAAIGFVLTFFEFPILPSAPFLKYDASDVPPLLVGFGMGPGAGLAAEAMKCLLFQFFGKNTTGWVGTAAMLFAGGSYVAIASGVYSRIRTWNGAVSGLVTGTLGMTAIMFVANLFLFLPLWGIPENLRQGLALSAVLPFNLLKGVVSSVIALVLYKRVSRLLKP